MAQLEAYIDFPEEDLPGEDQVGPASELRKLIEEMGDLMETQRYSALLHEGIKTLIIGEPNVGKSSLINALTGAERSRVSDIPGTTREYISAYMMLGSWRIEILDTAGIHEASDTVEKIGIDHTIEQAETADFFLLVLDANLPCPTLPDSLLQRMNPGNTIVIENKTDLPSVRSCADFLPDLQHVRTSLLERTGLSELREIWEKTFDDSLTHGHNDGVVVNARHAASLGEAVDSLELASSRLKLGDYSELIVADMRDAVEHIGQVVGRVDNERMLDRLFKQFCIGK